MLAASFPTFRRNLLHPELGHGSARHTCEQLGDFNEGGA